MNPYIYRLGVVVKCGMRNCGMKVRNVLQLMLDAKLNSDSSVSNTFSADLMHFQAD